jgi:acyl-CoA thioesterase-1
MRQSPDRFVIRRALIAGLASLAAAPAWAAPRRQVVTILGDSITAGLGLPEAAALPAQLEAALRRLRVAAVVRGAGVSGDTTADGLARLDFSVQADTAVCLVALGGNDLLQGLEPKTIRANLAAIVRRLKARRIAVVLAGQTAPKAVGAHYARDFNAVFAGVAAAEHVTLYPDLMAGVGPGLRQRDGIHPSAAGVKVIAGRLAPLVAKSLGAHAPAARSKARR